MQPLQFDGTRFWGIVAPTATEGSVTETLRWFDQNGMAADDGGAVLSALRPQQLLVLDAGLLGTWMEESVDGGFGLWVQPLDMTGLIGVPQFVTPLVEAPFMEISAASNGSDGRVVVTTFEMDGGVRVEVAVLSGTGQLVDLRQLPALGVQNVIFDGTRYLAAAADTDGGVFLLGLSGPNGEPFGVQPLPLTVGGWPCGRRRRRDPRRRMGERAGPVARGWGRRERAAVAAERRRRLRQRRKVDDGDR
jgi:hypothetical protein